MNQSIDEALNNRWVNLHTGDNFVTPDNRRCAQFSIRLINHDLVVIRTNGGTEINIHRQAFVATLRYLADNLHTVENPCEIHSNNNRREAGPLCLAARNANVTTVRIINYLLPLLSRMELVDVDGNRPNKTWLINMMKS